MLDNVELRKCSCGNKFVVINGEKNSRRTKCAECSSKKGRNRCLFCGDPIEKNMKFCSEECLDSYSELSTSNDTVFVLDEKKTEEPVQENDASIWHIVRELRLAGFNTTGAEDENPIKILTIGATDLNLLGEILGRFGVFEWTVEVDEWGRDDIIFRITSITIGE